MELFVDLLAALVSRASLGDQILQSFLCGLGFSIPGVGLFFLGQKESRKCGNPEGAARVKRVSWAIIALCFSVGAVMSWFYV